MTPSWRKPFGIFLILTLILVWSIIISSLSPWISQAHPLVQALAYVFLGIIWIAPLKPLLRWMETGTFR